MLKLWDITGDEKPLHIMQDWFKNRFETGTPTKNVNTVSPFLLLAYLAERLDTRSYLPYLDIWAEWVMNEMPDRTI